MAPEVAQTRSGPPRTSAHNQPTRPESSVARALTRRRPDASTYALLVIGGGAAGLAAARAGNRRGLRVALVSDSPLGGECTFTGCVPSKTLIEAAAQRLSFEDAAARMRAVVGQIAASEDAGVLRHAGLDVIEGRARFTGPRTVRVGAQSISARRVVVATGSRPAIPPIPGLDGADYLTNETVFALRVLPGSIAILGGGAVGCELAQTLARFGAEVHIFEAEDRLLPREEPEASAVVAEVFTSEGITLHLGSTVRRVDRRASHAGVRLEGSDGSVLEAEALLVAAGRTPNTAGLDPEVGGVDLDERGSVLTDPYLATSAAGVYAAGDVTGRMLFTHAADETGRLAVSNAFGRFGPFGRHRFATAPIPRVTFCDPEVASVGLSEAEAGPTARVAYVAMAEVDRAVTAGRTEGFVKLIAGSRPLLRHAGGGRLLGATIVCPRAGEMVHEVALAMRTGMFTGRLAQTVHAYPTWSTALRQAAAQFFIEVDGQRARPARNPPGSG